MTLIEAWKDSLQLCKPQAIKLMLLVTFNAMKQAIYTLFVPWFVVPFIIAYTAGYLIEEVWMIWFAVVFICLFLANRPTIGLKNFNYFYTYFGTYCWGISKLFLFFVLVFFPILGCGVVLLSLLAKTLYIKIFMAFSVIMWKFVADITTITRLDLFMMLFYLDKVGTIRTALKKALLFIIYNLSLLLIYSFAPFCVDKLLVLYCGQYSLIRLASLFFIICLVTNIYTKRVHDQYSLYQ